MMFDTEPQRWVVSYVIEGKRRATRHRDGCGVLSRARLNDEDFESRGVKISQHVVIEEGRYLASAPPDYPAPTDHTCVKKA